MKHVIIGTAGHVDHGKTTLIRALTGINTDRLAEEQARGMTIDLGFASLRLADGSIAGIVDVPGHERFLKNMLAGVSGVDVALLVVAADEGVMPQTREHLDILRLLDVSNAVVAVTKVDTVDQEWLAAVMDDIRATLDGTRLANSAMVPVSAATGAGLKSLMRELLAAVSRVTPRNEHLPARLPVDRAFVRTGHGVVVTGTLVCGAVMTGDRLITAPERHDVRVRGLQVHGKPVERASAGMRVAVNLAGVSLEDVHRGMQVAVPGAVQVSTTADLRFTLLPAARALRRRTSARLHIGTDEVAGWLRVLGSEGVLGPGESGFVRVTAAAPFAVAAGDRVVVRAASHAHVIGGGVVVDAAPVTRRRSGDQTVARLAAMELGGVTARVLEALSRAPAGLTAVEAADAAGLAVAAARAELERELSSTRVIRTGADRWMAADTFAALTHRLRITLASYHDRFPMRRGMPREELRDSILRSAPQRAFTEFLRASTERGTTCSDGPVVWLPDFEPSLTARQEELLARVAQCYLEHGLEAATIADISTSVGAPPDAVRAIVHFGAARGSLVRIDEDDYVHTDVLTRARALVEALVAEHGIVSVATFRDAARTNRKRAVTILEYFDSVGITRREADARVMAVGA